MAMALAVTPTQMECAQKASMGREANDAFFAKAPTTAVLKARFFTVLSPSIMMARANEVI